jgi:hypothetical protein
MSAVALAWPCRRTVACVAPFKVVRRDATGADEKRGVAHATQCDATCDARRSAVPKTMGPLALRLPVAKRNKAASSGRPAERAVHGLSSEVRARGVVPQVSGTAGIYRPVQR